jgi:hypothetical protein
MKPGAPVPQVILDATTAR